MTHELVINMNLGDNCQTDLNSSVENRFVLMVLALEK